MTTKIDQLKKSADETEPATTTCPGGGDHQWVLHHAAGTKPLDDKITDLKDPANRLGMQFEGKAAEHNKNAGTLGDSRDLSDDDDPMVWKCSVAGCHFQRQSREADHLAVVDGKKYAVEVKATTALDARSARQLGRNFQAAAQGAVAGVIMKIPSGPARNVLVNQIRQVAARLGRTIQIIRV